jgi:bifunctional oligoribonuclease and PAP phosphatase NrnA
MIHLVTHEAPDADALGSVFSAYRVLQRERIECQVHLWGDLPHFFTALWHLLGCPTYTTEPVPPGAHVWLLDAPHRHRCGTDNVPMSAVVDLLVDHHPIDMGEASGATELYSYCDVGSTCEILARYVFNRYASDIDYWATSWIYVGMRGDTLGFSTPSVERRTYEVLARLNLPGEHTSAICAVLQQQSIDQLLYQARIIDRARMMCVGGIWSLILVADLDLCTQHGVNANSAKLVLGQTDRLADIDLVVLLIEREADVRISFRSRWSTMAQRAARLLGGDGHDHAAGATWRGDLQGAIQAVDEVIKRVGP